MLKKVRKLYNTRYKCNHKHDKLVDLNDPYALCMLVYTWVAKGKVAPVKFTK